MNYISPAYDAAMKAPIRATAYHGCAGNCQQGRRPCDCSLGVAPIKSSTPRFSDLPITMEADEGPGLLSSRWLWSCAIVIVCAGVVTYVRWF